MKVNTNPNYTNCSFGRIYVTKDSIKFLSKLKHDNKQELIQLINEQKNNDINILIDKYNKSRLAAQIVFEEYASTINHNNSMTQRFFESQIKFIKRLCKKADETKEHCQIAIKSLHHKENIELNQTHLF